MSRSYLEGLQNHFRTTSKRTPNVYMLRHAITGVSIEGKWTSPAGARIEDISRRFRWQWQVDDAEDLRAAYQIDVQ